MKRFPADLQVKFGKFLIIFYYYLKIVMLILR